MLQIDKEIISCKKCPRLVKWRQKISITKRKAYLDEKYWGKPVPSFGSDKPKIFILGLAPGAHGANRTGRIFTGDSSGDWLYRSLFSAGLAKKEISISKDDGQELINSRVGCAVRCAPPGNKPTPDERDNCSSYLRSELIAISPYVKTYVALGKFAWDSLVKELSAIGYSIPKTKFSHGASLKIEKEGQTYLLIGSYHPSQQNTFTKKLTKSMLDKIFMKASKYALS